MNVMLSASVSVTSVQGKRVSADSGASEHRATFSVRSFGIRWQTLRAGFGTRAKRMQPIRIR